MTTKAPYEIAFVGSSGSGKTTLLERVLGGLKARGLRVGVVKHTHHRIDWDSPGKDSWRFREAGAGPVLLATPERLLLQTARGGVKAYESLLPDVDLVIHEGDRQSLVDKVLVGESPEQAAARDTRGRIVALVGGPGAGSLPWFDRDDPEGVVQFLVARLGAAVSERPADFETLLERSVAAHGHLCPGQVLGVRMSIRGLEELGLSAPPPAKRLIAVVETDRCAADAVASVSGCSLGKRTLKHFDFGKMAASFLDFQTGAAVRVVARDDSRHAVPLYAPGIEDPHKAQTAAYRLMPDSELMRVQSVRLSFSEADMPGRPRNRTPCANCGEHVSDGREVVRGGLVLCRACAGGSYYVNFDEQV